MSNMNAQQAKALQMQKNRDFMRLGYPQAISANAQNGNVYALGQLYNFDVPIVAGAYAEKIRIFYNVNYTNTPGATPGLNKTAAGEYALFSDVSILFGNKQATISPYFAKILAQARGYNRAAAGASAGGVINANIQNLAYGAAPPTSGANTWKGYYDIPLNLAHPTSPYGLIPMGGSGTRMQVQLQSASALVGPDPLNNAMYLGAGATNAVSAVGGSVSVVVFYRDYKSFATPQALEADLSGLPTTQIIKLREANPLTAGSPNYVSITNPYPFVKTLSLVIDGNSSAAFSTATNIQGFRIDAAENTSSALRVYDQANGGMINYYTRNRELYGQDFDEGMLIFDANAESTTNASDQDGEMWLNCSSSGYPAARLGFQVNAVGGASGITPRVVTYGVILNPVGIN